MTETFQETLRDAYTNHFFRGSWKLGPKDEKFEPIQRFPGQTERREILLRFSWAVYHSSHLMRSEPQEVLDRNCVVETRKYVGWLHGDPFKRIISILHILCFVVQ